MDQQKEVADIATKQLDIIQEVPKEIAVHIANYVEAFELADKSLVSQSWLSIFNSDIVWKTKISQDFNISMHTLSDFMNSLAEKNITPHLFQKIYKNLTAIKNKHNSMIKPVFRSYAARDKQSIFSLLACATDDPDIFLSTILPEERNIWVQVYLYGNVSHIFETLVQRSIEEKNYSYMPFDDEIRTQEDFWFCMASRASNTKAMMFLLDKKHDLKFSWAKWMLSRAINSAVTAKEYKLYQFLCMRSLADFGDLQSVEYSAEEGAQVALTGEVSRIKNMVQQGLIDPQKPPEGIVMMAIFSRSWPMVDYLLDPQNGFDLTFDGSWLLTAVFLVYHGGSTDILFNLTKYALDHNLMENMGEPELEGIILCFAVYGTFLQFKYLVERCRYIPDKNILTSVSDPEIIRYLLDPKNNFNLSREDLSFLNLQINISSIFARCAKSLNIQPNQSILEAAASISLEDTMYILDKDNHYNLKPDIKTLMTAFMHLNMPVVRYLLDPNNEFHLYPDKSFTLGVMLSDELKTFPLLEDEDQYEPLQLSVLEAILNVMRSQVYMQKVFTFLQTENYDKANTVLNKAYTASPSHCCLVLDYMLNHGKSNNLNSKALDFLSSYQALKERKDQPVNQFACSF